ncbi:MAG: glycoside hydrolase family 127 protein [Eubacteriales bacterium]|nr:glycoside hydrolase family 127 protein [Eubacteriales bacterium]
MKNNYSALRQLPPGDVKASGWLLEQLLRVCDGLGGHLDELEPDMIGTPYTTHETHHGWGAERRAGWGAEISGNYWNGLVQLAFTSGDEGLIKKADKWVCEVMANRRPDGYLGTYTDGDNMFDDYNAWGTNCGMTALLTYAEARGREDVFDAVYRCMLWFCENWAGDKKTRYVGVSIAECMMKCYFRTGDGRLMDFCRDYFDFLSRNDLFGISLEAMLDPTLHYNSNHGAGYVNHISHPALVWAGCGDDIYLRAAVNAYEKVRAKATHATGGVTCESEYLVPVGSNVETEYCAFTMYNKSLADLACITGDARYADDMERVVFNGAQGARKKDERAIAYLSSPNQIFATDNSSYADGIHQVYAPCVPVACCPVTSVRILPEFVRSIALTDGDSLFYAVYAPSTVRFKTLTVTLDTLYPFRDTLDFSFAAAKPLECAIYLRVPEWCEGAVFAVNGVPVGLEARPGEYVPIRRLWSDRDLLTVRFPMKVRIKHINDSDRANNRPIVFEYGPLLFSLPIPEHWAPYPGRPATPLPEGWHWYNVTPVIPPSGLDVYDDMGMRKHLISWNVAVDEHISPADVTVIRAETSDGYVWEEPLIKLKVPAYKAPYSYPPYAYKTFEPYTDNGRAYVTDKLELELVPYGCTALRITYFPRADLAH